MKHKQYDESVLSITGSGNKVHWLVERSDGSDNFEIREIIIPPAGRNSSGSPPYEHGVYFFQGKAV